MTTGCPSSVNPGELIWFVSARRSLSDADNVADTPDRVFRIIDPPARDLEIEERGMDPMLEALRGKNVLFLVHGYNNEFSSVVQSYYAIECQVRTALTSEYDCIVGYLWPGGDCAAEWGMAKRLADRTSPRFRYILRKVAEQAKSVDVMTHSLGARVAMGAIQSVADGRLQLGNLWLTAPAVHYECFEQHGRYRDVPLRCQNVFVFFSRLDETLLLPYHLAEKHNALGLGGPEDRNAISENVRSVNCKHVVYEHGGYRRSAEVFDFMKTMIRAPPKARDFTL